MKVTIELTEQNARWLRSMASLGRAADSITRILDECAENVLSDKLKEDCEVK